LLVLNASTRLHIDSDGLALGSGAYVPVSNLDEIAIRVPGPRGRGRGAAVGFVAGILAGSITGAIIGRATSEPCEDGSLCILDNGESLGALLFGATGTLVGLLVGAAVGTERVTVYTYRPDTPQQVSLVVGVGPSTNTAR